MNAKSRPSGPRNGAHLPFGITPLETAQYTKDLLISLHGIATQQSQTRLAELLEAAASEASRLTIAESTPR